MYGCYDREQMLNDFIKKQNIECSEVPPSLSTLVELCEKRIAHVEESANGRELVIKQMKRQLRETKKNLTLLAKEKGEKDRAIDELHRRKEKLRAEMEETDRQLELLSAATSALFRETRDIEEKESRLERNLLELRCARENSDRKEMQLSDRLNEFRERQAMMGQSQKWFELQALPLLPLEEIMQCTSYESLEGLKSLSKKMKTFIENTKFTEKQPLLVSIDIYRKKIAKITSRPACADMVTGKNEFLDLHGLTEYELSEEQNSVDIVCADGRSLTKILGKRRVKIVLSTGENKWTPDISQKIVETFKNCKVEYLTIDHLRNFCAKEMISAFGMPTLELGTRYFTVQPETLNAVCGIPTLTNLHLHIDRDSDVQRIVRKMISEWERGEREINTWTLESPFLQRSEKWEHRRRDGKTMTVKLVDYDKKTFTVSG